MTGGQLSSTSTAARTLANALTLDGTMTLGDATNNGALTFSGTTTIAGTTALTVASAVTLSGQLTGSGTLTKSGSANLYLTGTTNNNSGAVTINNGIIWLASDNSGTPNQLASVSSITLTSPGQLVFNGASSPSTVTSTISGGGTLVVATTNGVTFSGNLSLYTQQLFMYSTNTTGTTTKFTASAAQAWPLAGVTYQSSPRNTGALTQTVEYTGTSNLTTTGVLRFSPGANGHNYTISNENTGGYTLTISGAVTALNSASPNFIVNVGASAGTLTLSGIISQASTGVIALSKTGSGAATISGANTFTGIVSVTAGTLNANSATALGAASSTAGISVSSGATLSIGAAASYNSRTTAISGVGVSGVDAGCLVLAHAGPINLGAINATNNTYIRNTTTTQLTSAISWSGTGGIRLGAATGTTATFSGIISVTSGTLAQIAFGRFNNPDLGTVILSGTNTFSALSTIDYGTLSINSDGNIGTAPGVVTAGFLVIGGGTTLATTASFTLNSNRGIAIGPVSGTGTGTIDVATGTTLTYGGIVANNSVGTGKLVKVSTGTLKLTNANTYSGGTDIGAGVVQAGHINALGTSGTVTLTASGAVLQTLTAGQVNQNGKLTVAALTNSAGGTIRIGG